MVPPLLGRSAPSHFSRIRPPEIRERGRIGYSLRHHCDDKFLRSPAGGHGASISRNKRQERFKHANPAKAGFRQATNIPDSVIIEGEFASAPTNLGGNHP
jgi:hypothetical protein